MNTNNNLNDLNQAKKELNELLKSKEFFYQEDYHEAYQIVDNYSLHDVNEYADECSGIITHEYLLAYLEDEASSHSDIIEKAIYTLGNVERVDDYYYINGYMNVYTITTEYKEFIEYALEEIERQIKDEETEGE
jgi:hypothetical protein